MKKRPDIIGKDVIGIDECNNGFHINREFGMDFPMIVCGYLYRNYNHSCYGTEKYGAKGGTFTAKGRPFKEVLKRARDYTERNRPFLYTLVSKRDLEKSAIIERAKALATITLGFFVMYRMQQDKTVAVVDMMSQKDFSEEVYAVFNGYLNAADIHLPIIIQQRADKRNMAVMKADRIAFHIGGLKFKGNSKKWPFSRKRVYTRNLEELILNVKYPELFL